MNFKYLYSFLIYLFLSGCSQEVPVDQLTYKDGLKVLKKSGEPFTGKAIRFEGSATTPVEIIEYKQGKLDGHIQMWHPNGELKEDFNGSLKNEFYELTPTVGIFGGNADKIDARAMKIFLYRWGEELKWYDNGEMESEGEYAQDGSRKIGLWRKWHKNGELREKGEYSSDLGTSLSSAIDIASSGNKAFIRYMSKNKGVKIGKWSGWYENGSLFNEDNYNNNGLPIGTQKIYCKNGTLGLEAEFKEGIQSGSMKFWACDGKELDQVNFVNGKLQGLAVNYAKKKSAGSGDLMQEIGEIATLEAYNVHSDDYYKYQEVEFDIGKPSGLMTTWNEQGEIIAIKDYNKDNFINEDYSKPFLEKGKFGPFATKWGYGKWEVSRYNFKSPKPDIEEAQLYLKRKLINPAKKIIIKKVNSLSSKAGDSVIQWTYPIIVVPELLFDVIKSYPEVKLDSVDTSGQNRLHLCTILMLGEKPGRCSVEHFNYLTNNLHVNAEDNNGMTAINFLADFFHKKGSVRSRRRRDTQKPAMTAIQTLATAGADINHQNNKGQTSLMMALSHREYDIAKTLIELGADVNIKDKEEHNALHFVFFERAKSGFANGSGKYIFKLNKSRKNILNLLAQNGVQTDLPDLQGKSINDIALQEGAIKVAIYLESLSEIEKIVKPPLPVTTVLPEENQNAQGIESDSVNGTLVSSANNMGNIVDTTKNSSPTQGTTGFSQAEIGQEERLYQTALAYINKYRLSKPKGDSALDKLNELSALTSEDDSRVLELRQKISGKYFALATNRFNDYRYQDALKFIKAGQKIQPSRKATQLKVEIEQRIAEENLTQQESQQQSADDTYPSETPVKEEESSFGNMFNNIFD